MHSPPIPTDAPVATTPLDPGGPSPGLRSLLESCESGLLSSWSPERRDRDGGVGQLLRDCLARVQAQVDSDPGHASLLSLAAHHQPQPGRPVLGHCLAQTRTLRLTLIGMHRLRPIPLHDHPQTFGTLCVLRGRVQVRQYRARDNTGDPLSTLVLERELVAGPGDQADFGPEHLNIHTLQAITLNSVLLGLHFQPHPAAAPNWYFPIRALDAAGPHLVCNRLAKGRGSPSRPAIETETN